MKTNLDGKFKTSDALEKKGVWFDIGEGVKFLILPFKATNPHMKAVIAKYHKPYARQIGLNALDPIKASQIQTNVFVHACLVDWQGIKIDGVDTKFSKEVAVEFFNHLPDLRDTLFGYAQDSSNYRNEEDEELEDEDEDKELGNS